MNEQITINYSFEDENLSLDCIHSCEVTFHNAFADVYFEQLMPSNK